MLPEKIRKRISRADPRSPGTAANCVICGKDFKSGACPHNFGEIELAYRIYNEEQSIKSWAKYQ